MFGGMSALAVGRSALRRRRAFDAAICTFAAAPEERREAVMREQLETTDVRGPAWYLLGCACLRAGRVREAARAFGAAHHHDCDLETAALLTFACLKAREGPGTDLIERVLTTWEEMQRPDVTRRTADRRMLRCLASTTRTAPELSPLGRLIWGVAGPAQQARIESILKTGDERWAPILARRAPAQKDAVTD